MARSDKGKKRGAYKISVFREAARQLREATEASRERREARPRHVRRRERREAALPEPRVCPACGEVKLRSRQWVILSNGRAICLGCLRRLGEPGAELLLP